MKRAAHFSIWLVALLAAALAACSTTSNPRFPHAVHLARSICAGPGRPPCPTCNSCHAVSRDDRRVDMLPRESQCTACHKPAERDVLRTLTAIPVRPSGEIAFDHDRHLAMPEISGQCVSCHAGVLNDKSADMPPMSQCFSCHEHREQWQRAQCLPCHQSEDLRHTPPRTFLQHTASFARRHGQFAQENKALCQSCHAEAECNACHDTSQTLTAERRSPEDIERNFVHRGDFMVRHAIEADAAPARCARCHSPQTCDSCHLARGVSANRLDGRSPHPQGWVGANANARSLHGIEARRDILKCASCHEQGPATNCIRCHKVGAYGGNPHPAGWRSSSGTDAQMCRYCHG
jgi:hypothetical protein